MPSISKKIGPQYAAVAVGPCDVIASFTDDSGFFSISDSLDGSLVTAGHRQDKETPFRVSLEIGEYLHCRGRGSVAVSAANVIS